MNHMTTKYPPMVDPDLATKATLRGMDLPVYQITRVAASADYNMILFDTDSTVRIGAIHRDGVYSVIVMDHSFNTIRQYTSDESPHARSVFWTGLAILHRENNRIKEAAADSVTP